jgi:hypothetical protein
MHGVTGERVGEALGRLERLRRLGVGQRDAVDRDAGPANPSATRAATTSSSVDSMIRPRSTSGRAGSSAPT